MGLKGSGSDSDRLDGVAVARRAIEGLLRLAGVADQHTPVAVTPVAVSRSIESPAAAARVAAYIDGHALTKVGFAEKADIDAKTLTRLLKNHRALKRTWTDVAAAMGIEPDELLRTGQ